MPESNATLPLNYRDLGAISRWFADILFPSFPFLRRHARMTQGYEQDGLSLDFGVPSPIGGEERTLWICIDYDLTVMITFGPLSQQYGISRKDMLYARNLVGDILDGNSVILCAAPNHAAGPDWDDDEGFFIYLADPDELAEKLTLPGAPLRAQLKSWSGISDRIVELDDILI